MIFCYFDIYHVTYTCANKRHTNAGDPEQTNSIIVSKLPDTLGLYRYNSHERRGGERGEGEFNAPDTSVAEPSAARPVCNVNVHRCVFASVLLL